jgi:GrpB-like predicted nucleotidyltransferase (UPF0157 family)
VALRIDHVGSTSVPGLAAKPIVDIQISVPDISNEEGYVAELERLGVQLRSRDDLHRYFRPFADRPREVHVHVCPAGSRAADPEGSPPPGGFAADLPSEWGGVRSPDDGWAYTDAKSEVILNIMEEAESWAKGD